VVRAHLETSPPDGPIVNRPANRSTVAEIERQLAKVQGDTGIAPIAPKSAAGPSTSTSRLRSDSPDRRSNFLRVQHIQVRHRDQTTSAYQRSGSFTARSTHRTSPDSGRTAPTMTNTTRSDS
jgi:hypothetical protein